MISGNLADLRFKHFSVEVLPLLMWDGEDNTSSNYRSYSSFLYGFS